MKKISFLFVVAVILTTGFLPDRDPGKDLPKNSIELGERLFFDPSFSKDNTVSCASCHKPDYAFADNKPLSVGVNGSLTTRNSPSILYLDLTDVIFWDGRAQTVAHQAFFPITHPNEMGMTKEGLLKRINQNEFYVRAFKKIYNERPDMVNISCALADFENSLTYYDSPYDRFYLGDDSAISEAAVNGLFIFNEKGNCLACHRIGKGTHDLTAIRNIGLYNGKEYNDPGKFAITHDSADLGKFKVPHLRNIALTAPYMHDGSLKTLRDVIRFYNRPSDFVKGSLYMDVEMKDSLGLTEKEMEDLEAFMLTLTDDNLSQKLMRYKQVEMSFRKKKTK